MADEPLSDGEIRRSFARLDQAVRDVAANSVPLNAWTLQNEHNRDRYEELDRDCRERAAATDKRFKAVDERFKQNDQRGDRSWTRVLAVVGIAATLVAAVIGFYATTKGIK